MRRVKVYIKSLKDGEVVHEIEVTSPQSPTNHEKFMSGLLRKTDTDRYYVDDSEVRTWGDK